MSNPLQLSTFDVAMGRAAVPKGRPLAIAVSGGPDSMALLHLTYHWAKQHHNALYVLTIDHQLRPESAKEARHVADWCRGLDIPHHTLHWQHGAIATGVQLQARDARYDLMMRWCREHHIHHLLTGHHADDQIETMIMRLLRGSGLEGLAGILPVSMRHDIALHRPLLSWPKSTLLTWLATHDITYLNDPTNDALGYTRNQFRRRLRTLSTEQSTRMIKLSDFLYNFRNLLENKLAIWLAQYGFVDNYGYASIELNAYPTLAPELRHRLLQYLCHVISGNGAPVRSEKILRLDSALCTHPSASKHTLHGAVFLVQPDDNRILIVRERSKIEAPMALTNTPTLWDGRFVVSLPHHIQSPLSLGALGTPPDALRKLLEKSAIPKPVWPTLPALFTLEECVGLPHIDHEAVNLCFVASKPLEAGGFSAINKELQLIERQQNCA